MVEVVHSLASLDKKMPILIADDFAGMRKIVKAQLKSLGFENIIEAEDAQQMVTCLSRGDTKLLITDSFLPDLNLKELFSYVESAKGGVLPILLVAPESQKDKVTPPHKEETRTEVIAKPFTKEILAEKIAGLLSE